MHYWFFRGLEMNNEPNIGSIIYLHRGIAKYGKKDYKNALKDFKNITDPNLESKKYHYMGLCYYHLNLYHKAKEEYYKAIEINPSLIGVYYDLGVLYNSKNKTDTAKKLFETCINMDSKFELAWEAFGKLENIGQLNWHDWWFGHNKKRSLLGGFILFVIFGLITYIVVMSILDTINEIKIIGIVSSLVILLIIILSPNIKNVKLGNIELSISNNISESIILYPSSPSTLNPFDRGFI